MRLKWMNVIYFVTLMAFTVIGVPWFIMSRGLPSSVLWSAVVLWALTEFGITAGYHRLWSHKSWDAPLPVRGVFAVLGAAAMQLSILTWCHDHRRHHKFVDTDQDPYNAKRGFWWSHMGWILVKYPPRDFNQYVGDLLKDPVVVWQQRYYWRIALAFNVGVPLILAALTGEWLGMLLIPGLARVNTMYHCTWLVNSGAHWLGSKPWDNTITAVQNPLWAPLTMGEGGYHNYHHALEYDYRNGVAWYDFDPTKWLIWTLSRLGLAHSLRRAPLEVRLEKRFQVLRSRFEGREQTWGAAIEGQLREADALLKEALARYREQRLAWARIKQSQGLADARREYLEARSELRARFDYYRRLVRTLPQAA